jgi:hypothetical protein
LRGLDRFFYFWPQWGAIGGSHAFGGLVPATNGRVDERIGLISLNEIQLPDMSIWHPIVFPESVHRATESRWKGSTVYQAAHSFGDSPG